MVHAAVRELALLRRRKTSFRDARETVAVSTHQRTTRVDDAWSWRLG